MQITHSWHREVARKNINRVWGTDCGVDLPVSWALVWQFAVLAVNRGKVAWMLTSEIYVMTASIV